MASAYTSVFRPGLFTGHVAVVTGAGSGMGHSGAARVSAAICFLLSPAAAFVSGSCSRVDGAVPNSKRHREKSNQLQTVPFDGLHLVRKPKVLE